MTTGHFWSIFYRLFIGGFGILGSPKIGLAFVLAIIGVVLSIAWQVPFEPGRWKRCYELIFSQLLYYPAIIAHGTLYRDHTPPSQPPNANSLVDLAPEVLFGLSLVSGAFWIIRMKGLRWFAFCLVCLQQILVIGAIFVATMSITGDWL